MFRRLCSRKGQNTAEYAILVGLIVAAAVAMQSYVKRGLQGRVREAVDHVGAGGDVGGTNLTFTGEQYEPYYRDSQFNVTRGSTKRAATSLGGGVRRDLTREEVERSGTETSELGRAINE